MQYSNKYGTKFKPLAHTCVLKETKCKVMLVIQLSQTKKKKRKEENMCRAWALSAIWITDLGRKVLFVSCGYRYIEWTATQNGQHTKVLISCEQPVNVLTLTNYKFHWFGGLGTSSIVDNAAVSSFIALLRTENH